MSLRASTCGFGFIGLRFLYRVMDYAVQRVQVLFGAWLRQLCRFGLWEDTALFENPRNPVQTRSQAHLRRIMNNTNTIKNSNDINNIGILRMMHDTNSNNCKNMNILILYFLIVVMRTVIISFSCCLAVSALYTTAPARSCAHKLHAGALSR